MNTTERRKDRVTEQARENLELLERLNMTDAEIASNLGIHPRTVQKWSMGRVITEDRRILLHILGSYDIDLNKVRKALGLEVIK